MKVTKNQPENVSKAPKIFTINGRSSKVEKAIEIVSSANEAALMRSEHKFVNFLKLLEKLGIEYAVINPVGILIFLGNLETEVERWEYIKNAKTKEVYTLIHVSSRIDDTITKLFTINFDPSHELMPYSVTVHNR